jgi:uncharacterized protein (DUF362 family)
MRRREFLKTALVGAVAGAVKIDGNTILAADKGAEAQTPNDLVAVMGGEPVELYRKGIEAMGGMKRFVKKGQKVVVKPNIGWDKTPEYGANTNPLLVGEIVKDCLKAGAAEVVVFDHTCDEWEGCYKNSGIAEAAEKAGAKVAYGHDEKYYKEVELPLAVNMKKAKIHEAIINCDVWINVPVLKNHGGAKMTISMKNYMGIVWDRGYLHKHNLQQCIADATTYEKRPVLNIVDAYRIMTQNGPKGKTTNDVQLAKAIFMSTDIVAVDTAATKFFSQYKEMSLENLPYLSMAQNAKVGTMDINSLKVERIKL